jgi:hypothetical protein
MESCRERERERERMCSTFSTTKQRCLPLLKLLVQPLYPHLSILAFDAIMIPMITPNNPSALPKISTTRIFTAHQPT